MTSRPLIAITGGTGFLGRHVAEVLAAQGWRIRLLIRGMPVPPMPVFPVEVQRGDLADTEALRALVQGAQAVVHLAGLTKGSTRSEFLAVNRDGSARLAAAVAAVSPGLRFILVSSLAAREPQLSAYAESKRAGEAAVAAELGGAAHWVVLRPSVIYGPGDREGLALYRLAGARVIPALRGPEPRIALVHAQDVAAAVASVCLLGPSTASFEVTDECHAGYGYRELLTWIGERLGHTSRFLGVPDSMLLAAGTVGDAWSLMTGKPAMFGGGKVRELLHRNWASGPEQQLPRLVWTPRIQLQQALPATLAWWSDLDRQPPRTASRPKASRVPSQRKRPAAGPSKWAGLNAALRRGISPRSGHAS